MNEQREYLNCSADVINGFIELVRMSVVDQFPTTRVDIGDVEHLLEALHVLRPELAELTLFDGFVHVVRGQWHEAVNVFGGLAAQSLCMPGSKAMLIYCLSSSGNSTWRQLAEELLGDSEASHESRILVRAVIARNDMLKARDHALATGDFSEPESLQQLRRETAEANSDGAAGSNAYPLDGQYLRL